MGLYDRDYTQEGFQQRFRSGPRMRMHFPKPSPAVMRLLIINVAVFFLGAVLFPINIAFEGGHISFLEKWFSVFPYSFGSFGSLLQFWRLITYQFLHVNIWHLAFNMLWLYLLGPTLERHWGGKKFLIFYLGCGVAGALFYLLLVVVRFLPAGLMVGASGAILGVFAACAILFPQIVIYLFPFPVAIPIRVAAVAGIIMYILFVTTRSQNAGGHAAHLGGMAAGAIYIFSESWRAKLKLKLRSRTWEKKVTSQRDLQADVDRILQKVHESGIHSLTPKERKILRQATEAEQRRNKL